jgi:hypothetical protein
MFSTYKGSVDVSVGRSCDSTFKSNSLNRVSVRGPPQNITESSLGFWTGRR